MRALITGIGGFAGSYLAEHLLAAGCDEIWGVILTGPGQAAHLQDQVRLVEADLTDPERVRDLLAAVQPDRIYHLAGQSFVAISWRDPWPTLETNIRAQLNLLEAMVRLRLNARILVVGSQDEYGKVEADELPIQETTPLRPDSPYGVSKVTQDLLGLQYFYSYGVHAVRVRPFNHIGPRQNDRFVVPAFSHQIAEAEVGLRPAVIHVGNLETARDFSDVRDIVRAYHLLLERGTAGEVYNIGRGRPYPIRTLLALLLDMSTIEITIVQDPKRLRPSDVPVSYADISKIRAAVGWEPRISFETSVRDVLEYWRAQVAEVVRNR
ncbi:MAG: GDP-mannose 4,6-dehydratase [Ardenticatenaceae bacterium]|nr:GDP-mannose 4,6-dehydratase [Ardenticatenaceae bacterium]HBY96601.1 GDP-mannose 4,6-dehydratase [Chloroflexota bacterium]